jgi:signal transduction histidine kinase
MVRWRALAAGAVVAVSALSFIVAGVAGRPLGSAALIAVAGALVSLASLVLAQRRTRRRLMADAATRRAAAAERARLAREMHDSLSKTLDAVALGAAALPTTMADPQRAARLAQTLSDATRSAAADARTLIGDLRAESPDVPLTESIATIVTTWSTRHRVAVHERVEDVTVAPDVGYELVWILREALRNVAAHARATEVSVYLGRADDCVRLAVIDNGVGLPAQGGAAHLDGHHGLTGMAERARACGGTLTVTTVAAGTRVVAVVPAAGVARAGADGQLSGGRRTGVLAAALVVVAIGLTSLAALTPRTAEVRGEPPRAPAKQPTTTAARQGVTVSLSAAPRPDSTTVGPLPGGGPTGVRRGTGAATATADPAAASCAVNYTLRTEWNPGYIADITITNRSAQPRQGWTLTFRYPGDQKLVSVWGGIVASQDGDLLTIHGTDEHSTLAASESLTASIQGTWPTSDAPPRTFRLDGDVCATA